MNNSDLSIEYLLNLNGAKMFGSSGCAVASRKRLNTSQFLAKNYPEFDKLRIHLFNHNPAKLNFDENAKLKGVANHLTQLGYIKSDRNSSYSVADNLDTEIIRYLRGQWLEEYVFEALLESGVDEAYHGQRIIWGSDDAPSYFEIDVIARKDNQLIFVSCKAIKTEPEDGRSSMLRQFMSEAHTWNELLSGGKAKAIIVTTADMIDEEQSMKLRYAPLHEQARALNQVLIGIEQIKWGSLLRLFL